MTPQRYQKLRQVLDSRQPDLTVLLNNVHKPHNFSAILRSCDAVGVFEAHDSHQINTVEGLGTIDKLHALQEAFREAHVLQCGMGIRWVNPGREWANYWKTKQAN